MPPNRGIISLEIGENTAKSTGKEINHSKKSFHNQKFSLSKKRERESIQGVMEARR